EAGVDRGWPETGTAMLRMPGPFGCVGRLQLTVTGLEAGVDRGWPETGTAKLRTPDLSGCVAPLRFTVTSPRRITRAGGRGRRSWRPRAARAASRRGIPTS